ncbi:MAG: hypothetical protein JNG86_12535, partial [Verrucomicrobiaceae bacterium]|nr:hypothetical protein [Verrucomicrobiaceae bacterium]
MSATLTMLGLWKSAQISLPLLKAGFKVLRDQALSDAPEGEWEKALNDILGDRVKEFLSGKITALSPHQLAEAEAPLVEFTGIVLQSLVTDVLGTEDFSTMHDLFTPALPHLPRRWKTFVNQGIDAVRPMDSTRFLDALQAAHEGRGDSPPIEPAWLAAMFSQWIRGDIGEVPFRERWHLKLADAVAPLISDSLSSTLAAGHPVALKAFRESMLHFHTELRSLMRETLGELRKQGAESAKRDGDLKEVVLELAANQRANNKEERLNQYNRALLAAFRPYQELAIDHFAAGDQTAPDIWDIFVHPACAEEHLRPEEMDAAQRETPPRNPAVELLPLLAREDHRRTVLLGDP